MLWGWTCSRHHAQHEVGVGGAECVRVGVGAAGEPAAHVDAEGGDGQHRVVGIVDGEVAALNTFEDNAFDDGNGVAAHPGDHPEMLRGQGVHLVLHHLGVFVVAGILTPPDALSQFALAVPVLALYEISIWLVRASEKKRAQPDQGTTSKG